MSKDNSDFAGSVSLPEIPLNLVDSKAVARFLKINHRTVENPKWRKKIPHYQLTQRVIRYDLAEVAAHVRRTFHQMPQEGAK